MDFASNLSSIPLGPFDMLKRIGAGGMGAVYRATHRPTGTEVAVKVLRGEPDARALRRFHREVQAHAALLHPAIVQLVDYGTVDDAAADASAMRGSAGVQLSKRTAAGGPTAGGSLDRGGSAERALAPLMAEAERQEREETPGAHRDVLLLRSELLDELGVPDDDLQRVSNDLEILRNDFRLGRVPPEVYEATLGLLGRISARNAPELEARAWRLAAACLEGQAELADARECASRAIDAAERGGHPREIAMAKMAGARIDIRCAREDRARRVAREVQEIAEELQDPYLAMRACQLAAWSAWSGEDHDLAARLFTDALRRSREVGARVMEADAQNGLGETSRARGDSAGAIEHYREAMVLYEQMQQPDDAAIVAMNMSAAEIDAGHYDDARTRLEKAAQRLDEYGYAFVQNHLNVSRLALAAGTRDWTGFDEALETLGAALADGGEFTSDDLWQVRLALRLADDSGETANANAVHEFEARLARHLEGRRSPDGHG